MAAGIADDPRLRDHRVVVIGAQIDAPLATAILDVMRARGHALARTLRSRAQVSLVGGKAMEALMPTVAKGDRDLWFNIIMASFLVGAATGGVTLTGATRINSDAGTFTGPPKP